MGRGEVHDDVDAEHAEEAEQGSEFSLKSVGVVGSVKFDGGLQSSRRKAWRESGAAGNARRIPFVTRPTNSDSR